MNKKSKIISGLGIASTLAAATDFFLCKTLFDQTLNRKKLKASRHLEEEEQTITASQAHNKRKELMHTKKWLNETTTNKVNMDGRNNCKLIANIYPSASDNSHKWAILVHGYNGRKEDMRTQARHFHEQGYHILTPDLRGHGESEGNYICMGWTDRLDLVDWINSIIRIDEEAEIVLYGISMGAAAVMMCAGEELPANVRCVIEDCGYTSVNDILSHHLIHFYKMPPFPILDSAALLIKQRLGFSIKRASAVKQIEKSHLPMMFIHGDRDHFVPCDMVFPLYEACPNEKELYIVDDSGHAMNMFTDPDTYYTKIFNFIRKNA